MESLDDTSLATKDLNGSPATDSDEFERFLKLIVEGRNQGNKAVEKEKEVEQEEERQLETAADLPGASEGKDQCPKRKRTRKDLQNWQRTVLEEHYNKNNYLDVKTRGHLSKKTGLQEAKIRIWYQNKRYQEKRKLKSMTSEETMDSVYLGPGPLDVYPWEQACEIQTMSYLLPAIEQRVPAQSVVMRGTPLQAFQVQVPQPGPQLTGFHSTSSHNGFIPWDHAL